MKFMFLVGVGRALVKQATHAQDAIKPQHFMWRLKFVGKWQNMNFIIVALVLALRLAIYTVY